MKINLSFVSRGLILCLFPFSGCSTTPPHDTWKITDPARGIVQQSSSWPMLSTNQYARVVDGKIGEAILLLKDTPFIQLSSSRVKALTPQFHAPDDPSLQPYLIRALSYSIPPLLTVVRFDSEEARIVVKQFTYNGEIFLPYWRETHNAIVAYLPKAPQAIYPLAVLRGDGIGAGDKGIDTR